MTRDTSLITPGHANEWDHVTWPHVNSAMIESFIAASRARGTAAVSLAGVGAEGGARRRAVGRAHLLERRGS